MFFFIRLSPKMVDIFFAEICHQKDLGNALYDLPRDGDEPDQQANGSVHTATSKAVRR